MKPTTTFTALTAALAITLTACASGNDEYDEPSDMTVAVIADQVATDARDAGDTYTPTPDELENIAKTNVCPTLESPVTPTQIDDVAQTIAAEQGVSESTGKSITHAAALWCRGKFQEAFPDIYDD